MVRITNSDQIALILQARLKRLGRKTADRKPSNVQTTDQASLSQANAAATAQLPDDLDEAALGRLLIRQFLEDEFGKDFSRDSRSEQMIDRIMQQINADADAKSLFSEALESLRT